MVWFNPNVTSTDQGLPYVGLTQNDVMDAQARLQRFAPYLMKAFPETASTEGIIESAVVDIPQMKEALEKRYNTLIEGQLRLKRIATYLFLVQLKRAGGFMKCSLTLKN